METMGFNTYEKQDRVLVGMSGGVDSSVTVRILQEQGFAVQGAVIRFSPAHDGAVAAAKDAARSLGIDVHVIDAAETFDREVVTPFCQSYCEGRTPNPCILCNPAVKFRLLAEKADELDIPYLATGHYARIERCTDGVCRLCTAESTARDQSYMLYRLGPDILDRLILPLGEFEKTDVRDIARDIELNCADTPDSMEICFIPDGDYAAWLEARGAVPPPGHFVDRTGRVLGRHRGIHRYTIGQRRGLGIPAAHRLFVSEIRPETQEGVLSDGTDLMADTVWGEDFNPLAPLTEGEELTVRLRHSKTETPARFYPEGTGGRLELLTPARAPTPGQLAVLYRGDWVLGSLWITRARRIPG